MVAWIRHVNIVECSIAKKDQWPTQNNCRMAISALRREDALAGWLWYQRRPVTRSHLCEYKVLRLVLVPGFSWGPIGEAQAAREREFATFVAQRGRAPRYRSPDAAEKRLEAWTAKRLQAVARGPLNDEEKALRTLGVGIRRL